MEKDITKVVSKVSDIISDDSILEVGQWYWVIDGSDRWLGCITHVGSNYVEMEGVDGKLRVHFDEFHTKCGDRELDPDTHIDSQVRLHQHNVHRLMQEVKELTARLGVAPSLELGDGNETQALAKSNPGKDFNQYSKDLIEAKNKTLPDLFSKIQSANHLMAAWMSAKVIPLKAQAIGMKSVIGNIEDRIFSVELYAGLTEHIEKIADGKPADLTEKIHLLQRRHYMDEECLARYETGGMEFKDISAFDEWLCRADNLSRLLPFSRCAVAFQVRRESKEREACDLHSFINMIGLSDLDKTTFLYIRNGEQVFRMGTSIDFGSKLFPDLSKSETTPRGFWAKMYGNRVDEVITDDRYQGMMEDYRRDLQEYEDGKKLYEAAIATPEAKARAKKKGIEKPDVTCVDVPRPGTRPWDLSDSWVKCSPDSVYYDDIMEKLGENAKHHNKIALVLQGLLDRSPVFHPHPPWQIWTNDGFHSAFELIYDDSRALHAGSAPDFKEYQRRLNKSIKNGSVTVGQEDAWELNEGVKESNRRRSTYGIGRDHYPERFRPYGNPGPGVLAKVLKFSKKLEKCSYAWYRERQGFKFSGDKVDQVRTLFTCSSRRVLNVDAYKPGDFKIFFNDPRTRADYLRWAPLLLEAEEYHAGNRTVCDPALPSPAKSTPEGRRRYRNRKLRQSMMGKVVRLNRVVSTKGGSVYEPGTLWRVDGGTGSNVNVIGVSSDGKDENRRLIVGVSMDSFSLVKKP